MESLLQQRREDRPGTRHEDPFNDLSDRELLVMGELLTGASVKEVAERLDLQPTTVATYKARLFDKLAVTTLLELERLVTARNIHVGRK
jgi:two-component system invasion response regulator UvrY